MDTQLHDGVRLSALMERASLKDKDIADACNISTQAVGKWRRTGDIARAHIPTLARVLLCSSDELLGLRPIGKPVTHYATGDEARLLALFRRCSTPGRAAILQWVAAFVQMGTQAN